MRDPLGQFVGVDPDLTSTAFAVYDPDINELTGLFLLRASGYQSMLGAVAALDLSAYVDNSDWARIFGVVVEGQQIYRKERQSAHAKGADPNDLIHLAHVSGALYEHLRRSRRSCIARPAEWKGQRSKLATGESVCRQLGWDSKIKGGKEPYVVPSHPPAVATSDGKPLKQTDWKHLMDAIGIAIWASSREGSRFLLRLNDLEPQARR